MCTTGCVHQNITSSMLWPRRVEGDRQTDKERKERREKGERERHTRKGERKERERHTRKGERKERERHTRKGERETYKQAERECVWSDCSFSHNRQWPLFFMLYACVSFFLCPTDLFGIPNFGSGARENWGLVTYSKGLLLYNSTEDSERCKQRVNTFIALELAHQVPHAFQKCSLHNLMWPLLAGTNFSEFAK